MGFLLKTFLITVVFSQLVMAGRMYDPEIGRFISRDPAGYVDGMGLYNGYFAERFALDPWGLREFTASEVSLGQKAYEYADSLNDSDKNELKKAVNELAEEIKELPEGENTTGTEVAKKALEKLVDENERKKYAYDEKCPEKRDGPSTFPPESWKCNRFVADCYGEVAGWDISTESKGSSTGNPGYPLQMNGGNWPPQANDLANRQNIRNFTYPKPLANTQQQSGDIISYKSTDGGSGHTTIGIGKSGTIEAVGDGVRFKSTQSVQQSKPNRPGQIRRYTGSGK